MTGTPDTRFEGLLALCQERGLEVDRTSRQEAMIRDRATGHAWRLDSTRGGLNRVQLVEGDFKPSPEFADCANARDEIKIMFKDSLIENSSKSREHILAQLASGLGLKLGDPS